MFLLELVIFFAGTRLIPCDFLAPVNTHNPIQGGLHHEVANVLIVRQEKIVMKHTVSPKHFPSLRKFVMNLKIIFMKIKINLTKF